MKIKKMFLAALLICVSIFTFCGCGSPGGVLTKTDDVYGMGAVSTVSLLQSSIDAQSLTKLADISSEIQNDENQMSQQLERFNQYINMIDGLLDEDVVFTETEKNRDEKYSQFETKLIIKGKSFDGKVVEHIMYYNETLVKTETDDDEEEKIFKLEGVYLTDDAEFVMKGQRSEENEKDESSQGIKIAAYPSEDDLSTFVMVEQEFEKEDGETEQEYVYSIYSGGKCVEQTAVDFEKESEGQKDETCIEVEFISGEQKGVYEISRETVNGKIKLEVEYSIDGKKGEFEVIKTKDNNGNDVYRYVFEGDDYFEFGVIGG